MKKSGAKKFLSAIFLLILLAGAAFMFWFRSAERVYEVSYPIMGTVAHVTIYGVSRDLAEAGFAAARREFELVNSHCNRFDPESELSCLNTSGAKEEFVCSELLWEILMLSRKMYIESNGVFDISTAPLSDLWGFRGDGKGEVPSPTELEAAKARVGLNKMDFFPERRGVKFRQAGMSLDLGGVAKGYAIDRAMAALQAIGIKNALVDLGGNLRTSGSPGRGKNGFLIGIKNPFLPLTILPENFIIFDQAVSTSGNYERYRVINDKKYGHLINPTSGMPSLFTGSVTVIANNAALADAMSSAVFLGGAALAEKFTAANPGCRIIIYDENGEKKLYGDN